eukprot:CAMPEP_0184078174 /NCGR_PEP_ID=MMETSP0974-20121125/1038_1 /TAXON_ID=483370 /ORGANISM="non described non described, Strain CCMP2097" /LENGTH=291 /DNA_ID=CAMNT_0026380777 /DNA_START=652 /DNA_END=1529 /DNA_ORIENTATION=+
MRKTSQRRQQVPKLRLRRPLRAVSEHNGNKNEGHRDHRKHNSNNCPRRQRVARHAPPGHGAPDGREGVEQHHVGCVRREKCRRNQQICRRVENNRQKEPPQAHRVQRAVGAVAFRACNLMKRRVFRPCLFHRLLRRFVAVGAERAVDVFEEVRRTYDGGDAPENVLPDEDGQGFASHLLQPMRQRGVWRDAQDGGPGDAYSCEAFSAVERRQNCVGMPTARGLFRLHLNTHRRHDRGAGGQRFGHFTGFRETWAWHYVFAAGTGCRSDSAAMRRKGEMPVRRDFVDSHLCH